MNSKKAGTVLRKINSLYGSIDFEEEGISSIERDLMLNYIRQLYECFMEVDEAPVRKPVKKIAPLPEPPASPSKKDIPLEIESTAPKPESRDFSHNSRPASESPTPPVNEPIERVSPAVQPDKFKVTPPITERSDPGSPFQTGTADLSADMEPLFAFRKATELSERLSEQPISDLSRALSINDRLLYTNELFGRNIQALEDTLRDLNRFSTMDQAQRYLIDLARKYDWMKEERKEVAQAFVKLVRRRYL